MTTKRVETKVYTEHLYCECGGEMKQEIIGLDGIAITVATWPPTYYLVCDKCRRRESSFEIYPKIVYEEVEVTE